MIKIITFLFVVLVSADSGLMKVEEAGVLIVVQGVEMGLSSVKAIDFQVVRGIF